MYELVDNFVNFFVMPVMEFTHESIYYRTKLIERFMKEAFPTTRSEKIITAIGMLTGAVLLIAELVLFSTLLMFVTKLINL
jgi:tetrahydromethanopterin S-methyltransferase subunit F